MNLSRKSQTGNFYHNNRKIWNSRIWERLHVLDPPPENPRVFHVGFPFPDDFSKQIPLFSLLPNQIHPKNSKSWKEPFILKILSTMVTTQKLLEGHRSKEIKLEGRNFSSQKFQVKAGMNFSVRSDAQGGLPGAIFRISRFFQD